MSCGATPMPSAGNWCSAMSKRSRRNGRTARWANRRVSCSAGPLFFLAEFFLDHGERRGVSATWELLDACHVALTPGRLPSALLELVTSELFRLRSQGPYLLFQLLQAFKEAGLFLPSGFK